MRCERSAWESSEAETKALVLRCRQETVTVNTALWTAFLAAQYDVQGNAEPYRSRAGLAVSTRDKLNVPVAEAFGFYASSFSADLQYDPRRAFWDTARIFHERSDTVWPRRISLKRCRLNLCIPPCWIHCISASTA